MLSSFSIFTICIKIALIKSCQIETGNFTSRGASIINDTYTSGQVSLYYKMYKPDDIKPGDKYPTLVLVHGSGPNNHDEKIYLNPLLTNDSLQTFHDIASNLCNDYIIFTYDKRSCPPKTGATSKQPPCPYNTPEWCAFNPLAHPCFNYTRITLNDFTADAIEAVNFLKSESVENVDKKWIIPTGHSQGCDIVPIVADYHDLPAAISLMGAGIPINTTIYIQEVEFGYPNETIQHDLMEFELIANETVYGYEQVEILGGYAAAAFWYEWMNIGYEDVRKEYLQELKYFMSINSPTDSNVPPEVYMPLHEILENIASNSSSKLMASVNVIPDLIHEMVSIRDFDVGIYNVSDLVIETIRGWVYEITNA